MQPLRPSRFPRAFRRAWFLALLTLRPLGSPAADVLVTDDYNQWKKALGTNVATAAETIQAPPGFKVELIRSAQPGEGSWVAMAFDPRGRIVIAREDRGLLRLTLPSDSASATRLESINTNLLECRGLLFAHGALYANANNSKGLYRLSDTNGDDQFDEVRLLKSTPGNVGHGRNQLALGPDGMIYSVHGDDVLFPTNGVSPDSPFRHYAEDHLLPCEWDKVSFNSYAGPPYGHVIRTDKDGQRWELVAGGLRNPFGIAFNPAGDMFTYDADMEWDVGLSWYHPTRVLHLVPGGDYGWRRGTGVLPVWSPDTLPSAVDIGVGSPTAVLFGTKSRYPEPWRSALFIMDWAYGKIFAVHLRRDGPSYNGHPEVFVTGRPLNVTGLDFGPDGAMYFTTGGRRTQSGLYRVSWLGAATNQTREADIPDQGPRYEKLLAGFRSGPLSELWKQLGSANRWTAYAARVALEERPLAEWQERALGEARPRTAFVALLALARVGEGSQQPAALRRLLQLSSAKLNPEEELLALRAVSVSLARHGRPADELTARLRGHWETRFPGADPRVNQSLCELLVYLDSAAVARKTVPLMSSAATQNERFHYLFLLRGLTNGWSLPDRRIYFDWLARAGAEFHGANTLPVALKFIRKEAEATLTPAERAALADVLVRLDQPVVAPSAPTVVREFVREWSMTDLIDLLPMSRRGTNPDHGARLFTEAGCAQCHRVGASGGVVGPDLTSVGRRFDRRALLESIIEPSKVVAEVYRSTIVINRSGDILEGRVLSETDDVLTLGIHPLDPSSQAQVIRKRDIESRRISELSSMPSGLLNTLNKEEILNLLTWLESEISAGN